MLQICSGKLFHNDVEYRNNLKGIIYTNLRLIREKRIETVAGSVTGTDNFHQTNAIIYEIEELIESQSDGSQGILVSHGIDSLILDFSSILSFGMNCSASPSFSILEKLLSDQLGISTHSTPNKTISRVFDKSIICSEKEEAFFLDFVKHLIWLNRKTYLGVMNAIRTYVTGIQRISDDFELAYTLLVASIESLAQNFDGHQSTWNDYDSRKKKIIDKALVNADLETADKVREAILSIEHTSLNHRFQTFCIEHIAPSFFRDEALKTINPLTKMDLKTSLKNAYQARSQYIHILKKLPKQLHFGESFTETVEIDRKVWLTLQGLSRLARHVIIQFVMRQPVIDKEPYDYHLERSNIIQLKLSPEVWIGDTSIFEGSGRLKLEGFLSQLAACLERVPNASITKLEAVLKEFKNQISNVKKEDKRSFIAIYIIYHLIVESIEANEDEYNNFINTHANEILEPNAESLIVHCLIEKTPSWELETHNNCLMTYFTDRDKKSKFRCPRLFEAGMLLQLAQRYHENSDEDNAIKVIGMAVEAYPQHDKLQKFERNYLIEKQNINWKEILHPSPEELND